MDEDAALRAVGDAVSRLPVSIGQALADIEILVTRKPFPSVAQHVAGIYVELDTRILPPTDDDEPPAPAGVICLFLENIRPLDAHGVQAIFLHEAAHALGLDDR